MKNLEIIELLKNNIINFLTTDSEDLSISILEKGVDNQLLQKPIQSGLVFGIDEKFIGVHKFINDNGYGYQTYLDYDNGVYIINKYYVNSKIFKNIY